LFLADAYLVADLSFRDLSHKVINEAFRTSLASLQIDLPIPETVGGDTLAIPPIPAESCPPRDPMSSARYTPCLPTKPTPAQRTDFFRLHTYRLDRVMINKHGEILRRWRMRASRLDVGEPSSPSLRPGPDPVSEEWQIGDRRQRVVALRQPAAPGSDVIQEIGIPQEQIDQEVTALQRKLQMKLWIGAAGAVLVLLIAFAYVLRLLSRTRRLEAQAQMDDRLAFVGALAAGLAHEIRNPLNVLSMNLQMLEEEISARADSGESLVYTAALQAEIRRLSNLVNNFLSYARPNQPRFESRDLSQLLRDLCAFVRPEFERRKLTLRQELAPYLPPVDLDEAQIRQAILNILMNATHILQPAGTVTVRSRVGPDGGAVVSIEDDGPGIKEENREKIFEIFYSSRGGGTGLGLPIAARIIEAHGGSISVESGPGQGACFILNLPRRHPSTTAAKDAERSLAPSEGS
jgi:signal transduction histidine kinase